MKSFSNLWKYVAFLFAGIITGMVATIKLIEKPSILNVNTDSFIAEHTQKIGKLKQRGEGKVQDMSMLPEVPGRKAKRLARRAARRELRLLKDTEQEEKKQNGY